MSNPPGEPVSTPWRRATPRFAVNRNGRDVPMAPGSLQGELSAVAAHALLNSSSAVLIGIATLEDNWDRLSDEHRREILASVRQHATNLAVSLKELAHPVAIGVQLTD